MRAASRAYAERGVQRLEAALPDLLPAVSNHDIRQFFAQYRSLLVEELAKLLDAMADKQQEKQPAETDLTWQEIGIADKHLRQVKQRLEIVHSQYNEALPDLENHSHWGWVFSVLDSELRLLEGLKQDLEEKKAAYLLIAGGALTKKLRHLLDVRGASITRDEVVRLAQATSDAELAEALEWSRRQSQDIGQRIGGVLEEIMGRRARQQELEALGKKALGNVLERFLTEHPTEAAFFRPHLGSRDDFLQKLTTYVGRQVERGGYPIDEIAGRAYEVLRDFVRRNPDDESAYLGWMLNHQEFILGLAKAVAKEMMVLRSPGRPLGYIEAEARNGRDLGRVVTLAAAEYILSNPQYFESAIVDRANELIEDTKRHEAEILRLHAEEKWLREHGYLDDAANKIREIKVEGEHLPADYGGDMHQRDVLGGAGVKPKKPKDFNPKAARSQGVQK